MLGRPILVTLPLLCSLVVACGGQVEADPAPAPRSALPAAAVDAEGVVIEPLARPPVKAPSAVPPQNMKLPNPPMGP